jgi:hypothetical protein
MAQEDFTNKHILENHIETLNRKWRNGLVEKPKVADFPIIGKLPVNDSLPQEDYHYFVINAIKELKYRVDDADYLWKSIEND